jgi:hypothetical protein
MEGIEKEIHGLKTKIGLRKAWKRRCEKNGSILGANKAQRDINKWESRIRSLQAIGKPELVNEVEARYN